MNPTAGRIANVAAVVADDGTASEAVERVRTRLALCFDDVRVTPGTGDGLATALEAARAERVLLVAGALSPPLALLLALTAWPEHEAVAAREAPPRCALVRRDAALAALRRLPVAAGSIAALLDAMHTTWIEGADLARLATRPEPR